MKVMESKTANPLKVLHDYGQSVWMDYIRRSLIASGELARLIEEDGVRGVTSNPAIFEKAISGSGDYAQALQALAPRRLDAKSLYEALAIGDIQRAADLFQPLYRSSRRRDGYVSLEVSPHLAHDVQGTLDEARHLWRAVARANLMIKVPATSAGIATVERLIGEGINVNVTLLFSQSAYERVAHAYIAGVEEWIARGGDPGGVAGVASFFVSRIDSAVDALLAARLEAAADAAERDRLRGLMGRIAIANARLAYRRYREIFGTARWQALAANGAQSQRLLWASTSSKNPNYRDVIYVEELIGPDTVNTIPPATLDAFRDHGRPRESLTEDIEGARATLEALARRGISMDEVTDKLLAEGLALFAEAFDKLLDAVDRRCQADAPADINRQTHSLPPDLAAAVQVALEEWQTSGKVRRLWARDATLWTGADEARWLGWLGVTDDALADIRHLEDVAGDVRRTGFTHAVLLGMGGSSLCPEVMKLSFGTSAGCPELHVLDSTDPARIKAVEKKIDIERTLFIVSSKSGTTLEPDILRVYFYDRVTQALGAAEAGSRFIAITDPGSALEQTAARDGFHRVYLGMPSIGGRYSALSDFGMVPAAIIGVDTAAFLDRADRMVRACAACVPVAENPGVVLGVMLGVLAGQGRDKLTLFASPGIAGLGAWIEQLIAESTGKNGKGIIPVDRETPRAPSLYGNDRVFVYLRLAFAPDKAQDAAVEALERAGHPVVRITVNDRYDLGQEFFRWEFATAVAGSIMGINPFNQPDVEASKAATRQLTSAYERTGALRADTPLVEEGGLTLYTDAKNAAALQQRAGSQAALVDLLRAHMDRLKAGDYFALLAYVEMNQPHETRLQAMRHAVRDSKRVATCLGFGPRFLHSTGQAYKGGPDTGVFLQVTCDDDADLPVPGRRYSFGVVKAAQARGDFQVLIERNRRALRVHLGKDVGAGLAVLETAIRRALG